MGHYSGNTKSWLEADNLKMTPSKEMIAHILERHTKGDRNGTVMRQANESFSSHPHLQGFSA